MFYNTNKRELSMKERPLNLPKPSRKLHFSGKSPPEIFVGKYNYPHINLGILSPESLEDSEGLSMPEIWHEKNLSIRQILENRNKLIYSKFKGQIKKPKTNNQSLNILQEISMAFKPVSTEFFLKKPPRQKINLSRHVPIITNQAPLKKAKLQENPKVKPKVEYWLMLQLLY